MRRSAVFDPPEYLGWQPDPALVDEYDRRLRANPVYSEIIDSLGPDDLLGLYRGLLRNRLHDIALKRWVRQGVISKAWLGTGEEATTIGPVHALRRQGDSRDYVAPMIRNAGACHEMGMPVSSMLRGYLGTADSPSGGRDGHVGDLRYGVVPPISHVGDMVPVAAGIALAFRKQGSDRVALTWIGDGSTKSAAFHEGFNFAAVQRLPLVCVIQNNQVALGTSLEQHSRGPLAEWPLMYGVPGAVFDGNNVLEAYAATKIAVDRARAGDGASLLVAETFRMGGHATHDEREARETFAPELFQHWGRRDPIGLFEAWLSRRGFQTSLLEQIEVEVTADVEKEAVEALQSRDSRMPEGETVLRDVYC